VAFPLVDFALALQVSFTRQCGYVSAYKSIKTKMLNIDIPIGNRGDVCAKYV
jgi:hypothetical protein